jgi:prephenate dehydrogenase
VGSAFARIGIVGVGLIGGSVARAAHAADPDVSIVGLDVDDVARAALEAGVIHAARDLDAIAACDLIVLAAPVSANLAWMDRLSVTGTRALVTDVGGTKRQMNAKAGELGGRLTFVGGHPMAGSERSGFAAADAALFTGRRWFIVPPPNSATGNIARLEQWIRGLGAKPSVVDADTHDRVMAAVSALPQVTASALMAVVGERVGLEGLEMSGPGLRDTTRLAGSAATWMVDGLAHNSREVADAIDSLITELRIVRDQLDTPERAAELFARAQDWRRALLDRSR